ncbi:unnamed protein product [Allacma fusca]|uniref:Uncharacterized protein n=1 Tax=Allacma fusca TaxID=39272 RepID=A0A8J2K9F4_9HEXA|nr:unnamed protein product [Allacma fusca]
MKLRSSVIPVIIWCSNLIPTAFTNQISLKQITFDSITVFNKLETGCTLRLAGNHNLDFISNYENTPLLQFSLKENLKSGIHESSRHSPSCVTTILFILDSVQTRENFDNFLKPHRYRSMYTIVIAKSDTILQIFSEPHIQRLKYVLGICTDTLKIISDISGGKFKFYDKVQEYPSNWKCLQHRQLEIAAFNYPSRIALDSQNKPIECIGLFNILTEELERIYNASIELQVGFETTDEYKNGTLIGFAGEVANYSKDALLTLSQLESRNTQVDFTNCIISSSYVFYTSLPKHKISWRAIFYPFDPQVWMLVLISMVIVVAFFYIKLVIVNGTGSSTNSLFISSRLVMSAVLQQGSIVGPQLGFMVTPLLFYGMVLGTCYNSNLLSFITTLVPEDMPKTFEELSLREDYTINSLFVDGSPEKSLFNSSENPIFRNIGRRMRVSKSTEDCIESIFTGPKTVCMGWNRQIEPVISQNFTLMNNFFPLVVSSSCLDACSQGVLQKASKYLQEFNFVIDSATESGLIRHWMEVSETYLKGPGRQWILSNGSSKILMRLQRDFKSTVNETIHLKHFIPVLIMLTLLLSISLLSFSFEVFPPKVNLKTNLIKLHGWGFSKLEVVRLYVLIYIQYGFVKLNHRNY